MESYVYMLGTPEEMAELEEKPSYRKTGGPPIRIPKLTPSQAIRCDTRGSVY